MMFLALLLFPLLALGMSLICGLILFWPVMLLMGALHTQPGFEFVPPVGFETAFLLVALLYLLIPTGSSSSKS